MSKLGMTVFVFKNEKFHCVPSSCRKLMVLLWNIVLGSNVRVAVHCVMHKELGERLVLVRICIYLAALLERVGASRT
jgi:hypothetical protein